VGEVEETEEARWGRCFDSETGAYFTSTTTGATSLRFLEEEA
jgi:hypothetical protein